MKLTIKIIPRGEDQTGVKAFVQVNVANLFLLDSIRIISGKNGLFVSMPSFNANGAYIEYVYPFANDFRKELFSHILDAYYRCGGLVFEKSYASELFCSSLIQVRKVSLYEIDEISTDNRVAAVSVSIGGENSCFSINSIILRKTADSISPYFPNYYSKDSGGIITKYDYIKFLNKDYLKTVQNAIISSYNEEVNKKILLDEIEKKAVCEIHGKPLYEMEAGVLYKLADSEKNVVIPAVINNRIVSELAEQLFCNNFLIESVEIPDTVTKIGSLCFAHCPKLDKVKIPGSVIDIRADAFEGSANVQIHTAEETTAEQYAQRHGLPVKYPSVFDLLSSAQNKADNFTIGGKVL